MASIQLRGSTKIEDFKNHMLWLRLKQTTGEKWTRLRK